MTATSPNSFLNPSAFIDKGNGVHIAMSAGIADKTLLTIATQFRNTVLRRFRSLAPAAVSTTFRPDQHHVATLKYDGEGVFVLFDADADLCVAFNAPSGKARLGLPCIEALKDHLRKLGHRRALLSAELYLKDGEGKRTRVSDVIHATSSGSTDDRERLALAVYDLIMLDGADLRRTPEEWLETWDRIGQLVGDDPSLLFHRVEGNVVKSDAIMPYFSAVTDDRALEGLVVRSPASAATFKLKPTLTIDAVVLGFVEGSFEDKYGVLSILCGLTAPDGTTIQELARVGSGLTDAQRIDLLPTFRGLAVDAPIQATDSSGRPITFVRPTIVVEVEGEALREEALDGSVPTHRTFAWTGSALEFRGLSEGPLLTHATFGQIRPDKAWNDGGTRMNQVMSDFEVHRATHPQKANDEPTITRRNLFLKIRKKDEALTGIRKIVVIERNHPGFAPFALFYTDYSPSRAEPLQTELKIAFTAARRDAILEQMRDDALKRGWAEFSIPEAQELQPEIAA